MFRLISDDTLKHVNLSKSDLQVKAMIVSKCATLHIKKFPKQTKKKVKQMKITLNIMKIPEFYKGRH